MESVTYGKCDLWHVWLMASVSYGKCIMANVIMAKIFMANKTEPPRQIGIGNQTV